MIAKKYDCPACGEEMKPSAFRWFRCSDDGIDIHHSDLEAIERRTLARIAEAIEKQNREQRNALASGWRFEFSKARNEARWYSPTGESYIGQPCDEQGKT